MDCTFQTQEGRFNYRVGAIITSDLGLLLVKNPSEPYFYSVGGRVKMHETMDEAVEREVLEETGSMIRTKELGVIHENFFTSTLTGQKYHEVSFYYYVELTDDVVSGLSYNEFGEYEQLQWIAFDLLRQTDIRPAFLKELTKEKKTGIRHLVQKK
ncbi:NUDIX hydrolase [Candidatus Enterococcus mansonii]|uniref:Nudix hydrolase domain-containing protein n=1 Tax=Candidatus Enterococcus mansonii TaxID=1834181 RepID=A0A242CIR2_9ENTE|nr:NUDIX domain-containing protein [Enterococcus sp. 4G2_DIV0659]OTO09790.1 hypothetical protein A5880_000473 [Enterococcus sp. 4G2_DIV0659]